MSKKKNIVNKNLSIKDVKELLLLFNTINKKRKVKKSGKKTIKSDRYIPTTMSQEQILRNINKNKIEELKLKKLLGEDKKEEKKEIIINNIIPALIQEEAKKKEKEKREVPLRIKAEEKEEEKDYEKIDKKTINRIKNINNTDKIKKEIKAYVDTSKNINRKFDISYVQSTIEDKYEKYSRQIKNKDLQELKKLAKIYKVKITPVSYENEDEPYSALIERIAGKKLLMAMYEIKVNDGEIIKKETESDAADY